MRRWMVLALIGIGTLALGVGAGAQADPSKPATQPAGEAPRPSLSPEQAKHLATLEFRATQAFNRGEYAIALPLLQKLTEAWKDQPQRTGPLQEQIRVCQKNLKEAAQTHAAAQKAIANAPVGGQRVPHPKPKPGEVLAIGIKDLGNFEYDDEHGGNIPADVTALSGATLRLRGFMIPTDQADQITSFALVPNLFACCFGQPPQIQHTILVHTPKGKAVSYCPDEVSVEGKLTVEEKKEDGFIISIFELQADSVKPVQ